MRNFHAIALLFLAVIPGQGRAAEGGGHRTTRELQAFLENPTAFDTLNLTSRNVGDCPKGERARVLAEALTVNATLTTLNLYNTFLEPEEARVLAEALKVNATLTILVLSQNEIKDEGVSALAEALKVNATLTTLTLNHNRMGNAGAIALAEALKVNATLTTLTLEENFWTSVDGNGLFTINQGIGAAGTTALAEALKVNRFLTTLDLKNHRILQEGGDIALTAISQRLERNKRNKPFNLRTCWVILLCGYKQGESTVLPTLPPEIWEIILRGDGETP